MSLINMMEQITEEVFNEFLCNYSIKCTCKKCKDDILALTLNRIPPRYVSSHIGEVHIKTRFMEQQLQMDIMTEIARAILIVEHSPRHHHE